MKIAVLTATRAEYGLLYPVIKKLKSCEGVEVNVVVTGAHLSKEYGYTYQEIEADGIKIHEKIEILSNGDTPLCISESMGHALIKFGEYFESNTPDALLVLGDRYETLAVCIAAMNQRIPIIHLYGGETTEGAIDEAIRHAITKMSYLHLTSTAEYSKRVIQLGENPDRVRCVGALGVENGLSKKLLTREELSTQLQVDLSGDYAVVTFHPVTLENGGIKEQLDELFAAMDQIENMQFIVTKANADAGGRLVNQLFEAYAQDRENVHVFSSLGALRYLSAVKYARFVLGNSSSGLIEVPAFKVPTVNIGDRQKGRMRGNTVYDCPPIREEIVSAIEKAREDRFRKGLEIAESPYGDGDASEKIVQVIIEQFAHKDINLKKKFCDIEF